jgi:formamidopyrimidine-DNA glycosylase
VPELPEVETIARGLQPRIVGKEITDLTVIEQKTAQFQNAQQSAILGATVQAVRRRAKVMIWDLSSGHSLLFHLKMTGQVIYEGPDLPDEVERFAGGHPTKSMDTANRLPDSSTRLIFSFADGSVIFFNDQRKFGWVKLLPTNQLQNDQFLAKVGPEPDSAAFSPAYLRDQFRRRNTSVKAVLLDQTVVAGIGNIYADESLFLAKVHPARRASVVTPQQRFDLHGAIISVLAESIERGGTSFTNYVNVLGTRGDYLDHAQVFRREGQPCKVCGAEIIKTRVAGRGTYYCPSCQPAPRGFRP